MVVQHENDEKKGAFFIEINGTREALMTYSWAGTDKIIIDHTEVNNSLRGNGAGYKLVAASVDFARKSMLKIMPLCPFAKAVFEKKSEYNDVVF